MFHTSVTQAICINARGHAELHALPGSYCSAWESSITFTFIAVVVSLVNCSTLMVSKSVEACAHGCLSCIPHHC